MHTMTSWWLRLTGGKTHIGTIEGESKEEDGVWGGGGGGDHDSYTSQRAFLVSMKRRNGRSSPFLLRPTEVASKDWNFPKTVPPQSQAESVTICD